MFYYSNIVNIKMDCVVDFTVDTEVVMDETAVAVASVTTEENIYWSTDEVNSLIEGWSKYADEVNQSRNEDYMQRIADHIGTSKTAKQVRTKVGLIQGCSTFSW